MRKMTLGDLMERYTLAADDDQDQPLLSNEEKKMYFNDAELEAAWRSRGIADNDDPDVCFINVVAGQASYPIDSRILKVKNAVVEELNYRLIFPVKAETMNIEHPGWQGRTGDPQAYVIGLKTGSIRLYPVPDANFTINLHVLRTPLVTMESPSDMPEIEARYHRGLVNWVLYQAFSKRDVDAEDDVKAAKYLNLFEEEFGSRKEANAYFDAFEMNNQSFSYNTGGR